MTLSPATQTIAVSKAKPSFSLTVFKTTAAIRNITAGNNSQTLGVGLCGRIRGVLGNNRYVTATMQVALNTIEDSAMRFLLGSRGHGSHLLITQATSRSR